MDLLHFGVPGKDIAEDDLEAACYYEYAREPASDVLREAAAEYKASLERWECWRSRKPNKRNKRNKRTKDNFEGVGPDDEYIGCSLIEIYHAVSEKFERDPNDENDEWCDTWFIDTPWNCIWTCPGFPDKSWLELTKGERANIRCAFMVPGAQPLVTHDVTLLDAMGVLERLQSMSQFRPHGQQRSGLGREQRRKAAPIVQGWPKKKDKVSPSHLFHVLFTLDFKKNRELLRTEFDAWLVSPEIEALRKPHEAVIRGTTGKFKIRLKRLGVLRLARGFQSDCDDTYSDAALCAAIEFADANRKLDSSDQPRAFSDYRTGQTQKVPKNTAPLYNEPSAMRKAVRKAEQYLAELIPAWKRKGAEPLTQDRYTADIITKLHSGVYKKTKPKRSK